MFGTTDLETADVNLISGRAISTNCLSGIRRIEYVMITAPGYCNSSVPVQLQYRRKNEGRRFIKPSKLLNCSHVCVTDMIVLIILACYPVSNASDSSNSGVVVSKCEFELNRSWLRRCYDMNELRFIQLDHRGGFCDCWEVANLTVTLTNGQTRELR